MAKTKEAIKEEIKDIEKQIKDLKKEKSKLEKSLTRLATTFKEKFQIWYNNGKSGHYDWVPSHDKFPLVREIIQESEFTRYKTIDLERLIGEEVLGLFTGDDYREFYDSEEEYQADIESYQPLMEEIMKGNLKTFEYDW